MSPGTRGLIMLGAACALVVALVWVQIRHETAALPPPLLDVDPGTVRRVETACEGCPLRAWQREGGHWRAELPVAGPADSDEVERLIALATLRATGQRPASELDAGRLGLAPPLAWLRLDGRELRFGAATADGSERYVEAEGVIARVPERYSAWLFLRTDLQAQD